MPAGRPTKYTPDLLDKCYFYLSNWKDIGEDKNDQIPSHIALAEYIEISVTYMYEWAKHEDKAEFSDILEQVNKLQQRILINGGLSNNFNSNITKLVLGKHGFHERKELTGEDGKPIQFEKVAIELVDTESKDS